MSIRCAIDLELTEEELMCVLLSRAKLKAVPWPSPEEIKAPEPAASGLGGNNHDGAFAGGAPPPPAPELEIIPVEPPPLPPKPARRAKANGAEAPINSTPLAPSPPPEPEPLDEPAMRALLSKVGAVHPLKVKAITDLLEAHGGARRLSECDPSTWPAIATAANATLVEYGV